MTTLTRDDTRITRELWRAIADHADGFTVDALDDELPDHGYFVGGQSFTQIRPVALTTPDDVAGFVSVHPNTRFFGVWEDNGMIYIDAVDHVESDAQAHDLGRARKEIAIYNISTEECEAS